MKKQMIITVVTALLFCSQVTAFGAQVPADVIDTPFETAVTNLVEKGILTGNADGTFRPASPINRAEACVIIAKAAEATPAVLASAPANDFTDLDGYSWAVEYINYCASTGAVSGYPGDVFKPGNHVTYAEMAAMLINAMGYQEADLTGSWPDNYMNKALAVGAFEHLVLTGMLDPDEAATRGNVAIMTEVCEPDIAIQGQANNLLSESAYLRLQNNMLQAAVDMSKLDLDLNQKAAALAAADQLTEACQSLINANPPAKHQAEHPTYLLAAAVYQRAADSLRAFYQLAETADEAALDAAYERYANEMKEAVSIINAI